MAPIKQLDVAQIQSLEEMGSALDLMDKVSVSAFKGHHATLRLQKLILIKSGECVSKLMALSQSYPESDKAFQAEKHLFLKNRDIIKRILTFNQNVITDFQEKDLDRMNDPSSFFKTSEWRHPHYLISLASYWQGWNGYYGSLLFSKDDPMKKRLLQEAIDGFSRAFVDFKEDAIITKTLVGRGLCYKEMNQYESAMYDLKSAKDKAQKGDPVYLRCLYEQASISYETGNAAYALKILDGIREDFPEKQIPDTMKRRFDDLRARVLLALLEKQGDDVIQNGGRPDKQFIHAFIELRALVRGKKRLIEEFYGFSSRQALVLRYLPYVDRGAIATIAIGDSFFDKGEYDEAMDYYQMLQEDAKTISKSYMDKVCFRLGFISCEKGQWRNAIRYLENFEKKFQDSLYIEQAVSLCYLAAQKDFKQTSTKASYEQYIDSIRNYVSQCKGTCTEMSDAHFQLGQYYEASGKKQHAVNEYLLVTEASPNYLSACYSVLKIYVDALEERLLNGPGRLNSPVSVYQDGMRLVKTFHQRATVTPKTKDLIDLIARMVILEARLHLYGPGNDYEQCLIVLKGFDQRFSRQKDHCFDAAMTRVMCLHEMGRRKHAEAEVVRLINGLTGDLNPYIELHQLAKQLHGRAKSLRQNGEDEDTRSDASFALMIYQHLYDKSQHMTAYKDYGHAIELKIAKLYLSQNRLTHAIEAYAEILNKDPLSADAVYGIGLLYEKMGKWEEALDTWRKFSDGVKAGTYHWFDSRYRTAFALNKMGKPEKACAVITMTLVLHPDMGDDDLKKRFIDLKADICDDEAGDNKMSQKTSF
ncbi:MAG: tetratricopeptide repeat protein [Desulfatitalea sp.]|nr:tetratricopeptide repeat protein [Desulfatitalea sp.]NNJ98864.1 tetratricopeptide repeat protein [Desulfatitalea sp.]